MYLVFGVVYLVFGGMYLVFGGVMFHRKVEKYLVVKC